MYTYNPIEDCYATKKKILIFRDELQFLRKKMKRLNILDFGCGNANDFGKYFFNQFDNYPGFDIHQPSINFASKKFSKKNIRFTTKSPHSKFDVIFVSEVLEHLDNPQKTLTFLNSLLNKNGIILASTPNGYGLTEIEKFIIHKFGIYKFLRRIYKIIKKPAELKKEKIPFNFDSGHIQFFTFKQLKKIINNASLKLSYIKNGTVLGADISGATILKFECTKKLNTFLADFLPTSFSATWIFKLVK